MPLGRHDDSDSKARIVGCWKMTKESDFLQIKQDMLEMRVEQLIREMEDLRQSERISKVMITLTFSLILAMGAAILF